MSRAAWAAVAAEECDGNPSPGGYLAESEMPLAALIFLTPLILLYEVGTRYFITGAIHGHEQQIIAFVMLRQFFDLFGATGRYLPALAVVGILMGCHVFRKDPWKLYVHTIVGMAIESAALALPVLVIGYAVWLPLAADHAPGRHPPAPAKSSWISPQASASRARSRRRGSLPGPPQAPWPGSG